jgi:isopentenyl-diphosphate Delta-isomerase
MEHVILVDSQDREIGTEEKLKAHKTGQLHRAVSVFLTDENGHMLLQQRAFSKYHSGGLWSNTCCGHPRPQESCLVAATRRLEEEMGIHQIPLFEAFCHTYRAELDQGLIEYEFDHIFIGTCKPTLSFTTNPEEVASWKWLSLVDLEQAIDQTPEQFTVWFRLILPIMLKGKNLKSHV